MTNNYSSGCFYSRGNRGLETPTYTLPSVAGKLPLWLILLVTVAVYAVTLTGATAQELRNCPPGLVHYYGLDEKEATTTYEDYAGAVPATCSACPAPAASRFAGGQRFDGKDDGLNIADIRNFEWGPNSNFTIELWVQTTGTSANNRVMIGRKGAESGMVWWVGVGTDGYALFELRDRQRNGFVMGHNGKKVNDGKWHHVAVVRDGIHRRNKLYVDGYKVGDFEFDYKDNFESTSPVNIGHLNLDQGYRFNGVLDEVMVYNRALMENEMRLRYNNGAGNYCGPGMIIPEIVSEPVTYSTVGQSYFYDVDATGMPLPRYSLVATQPGMTINATTGEITWSPTAPGSYTVTVRAENSMGSAEQTFKIDVKNGLGEESGLSHHWMLHEISGTRYRDFYTPFHAFAENKSKPTPIPGVVSGGQRFDGQGNGIEVNGSPNFNWKNNSNFSIELWMRSSASPALNQVILGRDAKESNAHWWIGVDTKGKAGFQLLDLDRQGVYVGNAGPSVNDGKWHQLFAVRDGSTGTSRLYIDGEQVAEGRHIFKDGFASLSPVTMGYLDDPNNYYYEGDLDEVKLFGRALSAAEIRRRFQEVYDNIVELVKFEGRYANSTVLLNWETQTEMDLKSFTVERSSDGNEFTEIGTVDAAGNSSSSNSYNFTDKDPLKEVGYYRLKINKANGSFTYSVIIMVEYGGPTASSFFVYPNPIRHGDVQAEVTNLVADEQVTFVISDLSGRRLVQEDVTVEANGTLKLEFPVNANYRPGIYSVTIITKTKTLSRKLIVL